MEEAALRPRPKNKPLVVAMSTPRGGRVLRAEADCRSCNLLHLCAVPELEPLECPEICGLIEECEVGVEFPEQLVHVYANIGDQTPHIALDGTNNKYMVCQDRDTIVGGIGYSNQGGGSIHS